MQKQLAQAVKHWRYVAPMVTYPQNASEFEQLVCQLDELLELVGENEQHPLIGLVDFLSYLIEQYEETHVKAPSTHGIDALKYLMETHHLKQADLKELGSQGVVSEILNGKRSLNVRQITLLSKRFHVDPSTFIDGD